MNTQDIGWLLVSAASFYILVCWLANKLDKAERNARRKWGP